MQVISQKERAKHLAMDLGLVAIMKTAKGNESTEHKFILIGEIIKETEELVHCIDFLRETENMSQKEETSDGR